MRVRGITIVLSIMCIISSMVLIGQDAKQLFKVEPGNQVVCASNIIHERLMNEDTEYRESFEANERVMEAAVTNAASNRSPVTLTIPIVVHIMHIGEAVGTGSNISDAQVQSAIDALNEDYRKMPGTNGFGDGVDSEIEFCLASRDPNGNPTNGINRINASGLTNYAAEGITAGQGSGANETDLKALSKWDRDDYYNIWIVTEIEDNNAGGGIQGYAYFPNSSVARDGTVIMYNAFGTVGNLKSYTNLNRTTTHELGHAFFLYHTFQGNSCSESNCDTQGDRVCDTPPTTQSTSCNSPACSGTQQVENYMDYTSQTCMNMFTQGQKDRMRDAIQFMRPTLLNSLGCTPPNALDVGVTAITAPIGYSCETSITPEVEIKNFGSTTLTSVQVKYRIDSGTLNTYQYNGSLASGESASITLPAVGTSVGTHNLEVYTESPNGGTDGFQSNDSANQDFEVVNGSYVTVAIAVDNYGSETTWDVTNGSGDIVATGGPYPNDAYGTTFETDVCLPEGCFEFNIYDSYGDGICCGQGFGGYTITDAGGTILIENGDDFDYTENRPFCTTVVEEAPEADFTASQTTICEGSSVQLIDQSSGAPTSWNWSFPGGSPSSSTEQNPLVTYTTSGAKTVTLTVTNENGSDLLTESGFINVGGDLSVTGTTSSTSCHDSNDGSINVSVNGGSSPYSYSWSHGPSSQDVSNLSPGSYNVTVQDAGGCEGTASFTISSPSQISLSVSSTAATCASAGTASVTASGGSPGFTYLWNDNQQQTTSTADVLMAGTYTVIVTDSEACQATAVVTVDGSGDMMLFGDYGDVSCNGAADGYAVVNVNGGNAPFDYNWDEFPGLNSNAVDGLSAGTYTVVVTDANGCQSVMTFTISEAAAINISVDAIGAISCNGIADGSISMSVNGGQGPYSYNWNPAGLGTNPSVNNLSAGTYVLSVTDANGCQSESSVTLTEPSELVVTLTGTNASCNGSNDGTLEANFSGGTAPYSYNWNGAGFGQTMNPQNVFGGSYLVRVTDANGCFESATADVLEPSAINLSNSNSTMASCINDGTATVAPTGGAQEYTYLWSDPQMQTTATATELAGGSYTVIVTDAIGCQKTKEIAVESSSDLNLENGSKVNATCAGYGDGSATVAAQGGDGTFTYQWNDPEGQTGATAQGLMAGVYGVIVTDGTGCQASRTFNINEPDPIETAINEIVHDSCGLSVGKVVLTANGGTGTKSFVWDDTNATTGNSLNGVSFGIYTAEIIDENQCQGLRTIEIEDLDCVGATSVEDLSQIGIGVKIFPNPITGTEFSIRLDGDVNRPVDLVMLDITGKTVLTDRLLPNVQNHNIQIDGNQAEGIYLLQLTDGVYTTTERIVVIR